MVIDSLTGVFNRSYLDKQFVPSLGFCHKEDLEVNIAFIDMDNFKKINDDHGHIIGDAILNYVGTFFKVYYNDRTRNKERIVVRYGGDEFIIICTGINYEDFKSEFLTHLKEFNKKYIDTEHKEFNFSLSYGFASNSELEYNMTWNDLIDLADKRMYTSKPYKNRGNNHD
jgi:diguanylate cyclase (GGDEF)-like protein